MSRCFCQLGGQRRLGKSCNSKLGGSRPDLVCPSLRLGFESGYVEKRRPGKSCNSELGGSGPDLSYPSLRISLFSCNFEKRRPCLAEILRGVAVRQL